MSQAADKQRAAPAGSVERPAGVAPPRLVWGLWILLSAAMLPVCQAQGLWVLMPLAPLLAALGIRRTLRRGRPSLGQGAAAAIAVVLAALAGLVQVDTGLIGIFAVADWLIAVVLLKCWQLGNSRDCAHVLVIAALLLLVGAMVSGQLIYAISLITALAIGPATLMQWHLLAEQERLARLTPRNGVTGTARPSRLRRAGALASLLCAVAGFVIFATFPRLRTPLQPNVQTAAQAITGFSTESRLNEMGQLQRSDRVYMRVRLSTGGMAIGGEDNQPYFRAMTYNLYNGRSWEESDAPGAVSLSPPTDSSLLHFRKTLQPEPVGLVDQEYWVEAGPPPRLFCLAMSSPIAIASQEIHEVQWRQGDETLVPIGRCPPTVHYKVLSVPRYVLSDTETTPARPRPLLRAANPATQTAPATRRSRGRGRGPRSGPVVQQEVIELASSLAAEVTGNTEDPAADPTTHERIVNRFMQHLAAPPFVYTLEGTRRAAGYGALETFLFKTHRGYCEYFATALTVMCQSVGIPARYVTGFHGGQYNDVGQFYAVRDSDAHSWVEVWLGEAGWRTFDPTPAERTQYSHSSLRSRLAGLLDYLQFQWSSWVVAYDILHRETLFGTFGDWMQPPMYQKEQSWTRFLWTFQQLLMGPETLSPLGKVLYWLGLLAVLSLSGYLLVQLVRHLLQRVRLRRQTRAASLTGVRFYRRVVAALARQGFVRRPAETPREFALRVEQSVPQVEGLFVELIERYYATRFGGAAQGEAGERLCRQMLGRLSNDNRQAARRGAPLPPAAAAPQGPIHRP